MNPQLPVLKGFKAVEAKKQPPERWWVRYYSYAFFCVAASVVSSGVAFFEASGVRDEPSSYSRRLLAQDVPAYNRRVRVAAILTGSFVLVLSIAGCVVYEATLDKREKA
jgi:hypothetical protein